MPNLAVARYFLRVSGFVLLCSLSACGASDNSPGLELDPSAEPVTVELSALLSELDGLEAPEGADSAVFNELREALARILEQRGDARFTSAAPQGSGNAVSDLELNDSDPQNPLLEWTYLNSGDYDSNSVVSISDLTPLGIHFLKDSSDAEWESLKHVDGDGNGLINISDVTPIGVNFLATVAVYGIGIYDEEQQDYIQIAEVPFSAAAGSPLRFSVPLPAEGIGKALAVRPGDGAGNYGPWSGDPLPQPIAVLPGPPGDSAVDHIPDMPFGAADPSDFFIVEADFALSHRRILVHVDNAASVGAFNAALAAVDASIIGGIPEGEILLLWIEAQDFSQTAAALESLLLSGVVSEAVPDMDGSDEALPLHTSQQPDRWTFEQANYAALYPQPPTAPAALPGANYWVKTIRAPQVWNFDTYVRRNRSANKVSLGVLDSGFDTAHEDLAALISLDGTINGASTEHGTFIAGIMGANAGNGLGIAGINPWLERIHVRRRTLGAGQQASYAQNLASILTLLGSHSEIRSINQSSGQSKFYSRNNPPIDVSWRFGDRNGNGLNNDAGEWAAVDLSGDGNADSWSEVMAHWGRLYNNTLLAFDLLVRSDYLLSSSAGNAGSGYMAQDNSPINAAALVNGHCLSVESSDRLNTRSQFSDREGSISAPGDEVRSCEAVNAENYDENAPGSDTGAAGYERRYATNSGTSFAAPQVSALAGLLWKLDPQLTYTQVRGLITAADNSVITKVSGQPAASAAPRIDLLAAVLAIDGLRGNKLLQQALADIDDGTVDGNQRAVPFDGALVTGISTPDQRRGDGQIDMSDFRAFRDAFLVVQAQSGTDIVLGASSIRFDGGARHFKNDLNMDGVIDGAGLTTKHPVDIGLPTELTHTPPEDSFPRYDLNGDGRIGDWSASAAFRSDPDLGFSTDPMPLLRSAPELLRDLDVLLDEDYWTDDSAGYEENAGNRASDEGSLVDNGSWLPRRFLLENRDSYLQGTFEDSLGRTPDYLHSCDFHLRIDWDSFDVSVQNIYVRLRSEMSPDQLDNDGEGGIDEPFEMEFERYATLIRQPGTEDITVSLPLWTGTAEISWNIMNQDDDCVFNQRLTMNELKFGDDIPYFINAETVAAGGWSARTLDTAGDSGKYGELRLVGGKPAVAYFGNGNIRYVQAQDAEGLDWNAPVDVAEDVDSGISVNLSMIGGRPAIGYSDFSFEDETLGTINSVNFVRALDGSGSAWDEPVSAAQITTGIIQMGWHNDLLELSGKPAICFLGEDYGSINPTALNFLSASDAAGTDWGSITQADRNSSPAGLWCSMELIEGMPAIAYLDATNHKLCFVRASSSNGSNWGQPLELDGAGGFDYFLGPYPGRHASLELVAGAPAIAYFGGHDLELGSMLKYIRATDSTGGSWADPLILHSGSSNPGDGSGLYCSLAVVSGAPAVSFHNQGDGDLMYVEAFDAEGMLWFEAEEVDCIGTVGAWSSLVELADGSPGISYYDSGNQNLRFATR